VGALSSGTGLNRSPLVQTLRRGTNVTIRRLRDRRADSRAIDVRSAEDPRLLFRPGTGNWYVQLDERWYQPVDDADVDALITLFPVEVLDEQVLSNVGSAGGFVRVVDAEAAPSLEFLNSFGDIVRRVANRIPGLLTAVAEWEYGAHADGWVETQACLRLDGVRRCSLVAFLPEQPDAPGAGDKELAVQTTVGRHSDVDIHRLHRGKPTLIELLHGRSAVRGLLVKLQTSNAEPADDDRPLGFVVVRIELLA
jgi:hypothetical protein